MKTLLLAERHPFPAALALAGLAFLVRLYGVLFSNIIANDGVAYITTAKVIESEGVKKTTEFAFIHLYPFLILLFHKVIPDWEMAGRMVSAVLGSLALIPLYLLVRGILGFRVALAAALFYAVHPGFAGFSSDVLREPTFWFLCVTAVWLAWRGVMAKDILSLVLSSLAVGLSIFTRMEGVTVLFFILIWMVWHFLKEEASPGRLVLYLLVFVLAAPIMLSPLLLFLKSQLGRWEFGHSIGKIAALAVANDRQAFLLEPDIADKIPFSLLTFIALAKDHCYVVYFADTVATMVKSMNVSFFVLLLFGTIRRRFIPYRKEEFFFLVWFILCFLAALIYVTKVHYLSTRHGLMMVIPALVWVGIGFLEFKERILHWTRERASLKSISKYGTAALVGVLALTLLPATLSPVGRDKREMKQAGFYLKKMGYGGSRITGEAALFRIGFYGDSEFVPLPRVKTFDELARFMRENGATFLVVDGKADNPLSVPTGRDERCRVLEKLNLPGLEGGKDYALALYKLKK